MPQFRRAVALRSQTGSRVERVIALVDPDSTYALMPSPLLQMLGIDPQWSSLLQSDDGSQVESSLAEVRLTLDEQERTTICVFGSPDAEPRLGHHTLLGFGLTVDSSGSKLVPAKLFRA